VTILNSLVTATGGAHGAAIEGGHDHFNVGTVAISNSTETATGKAESAGM
jgi:hypothetical protein